MHIPDGVLDPAVLIGAGAASAGAVVAAGWTMRHGRPRLGLALAGGAGVLVAHLVDVTLVGSQTAHLIGGALLAIALGPSLGLAVMTAVLALEALAWGDGGVAALGANVLVMGVAGVLAGWWAYRGALALVGRLRGSPGDAGRVAAAAVGGFASVLASTAALVGAYAASGVSIAAVLPHHLAWAGLEAAVTGAVVAVALAVRRTRARAEAGASRRIHVLDGDLDALG